MVKKRFLAFLFIALLFFIIFEIVFIAYIQSQKITKTYNNIQTKEYVGLKTESEKNNLISEETIKFINKFKNLPNQKIYLTIEQIGYVKENRYIEDKNPFYHLTIEDENQKKLITYSILPKSNKTFFYKLIGNTKTPVSINELKPGNKILKIYKEELMNKENYFSEFIILGN